MRFHSKNIGLIQRSGLSALSITGGLLLLLLVAAVACEDAEPQPTAKPTLPVPLVDATDVEVVYAFPAYPQPWGPGEYDPLWGDLDADAPIIDRLLRAIESGTPVEMVGVVKMEEELTWAPHSNLVMNLRFRDGTTWSVRHAIRCDLTSEGKKTNCLILADHWEVLPRNEVVVSTALTEWFERVQEYMPTVKYYEVPDPITLGEPFAISGAGHHEGDRVELSIEFIDESVMSLGDVPLDHGAFHWEGEIPETAHPGLVNITMRGFEGTERARGTSIIRHSVTVIGDVDVVYASQERQPRSQRPGEYDPLWGDLHGDVSAIEQLLKAITMGTVGSVRAEEGIAFSDHGLAVNVRFRDRTIWSVKQVIKCNLTPEGRMTNCGSVPDQYHWNLLHPNQIAFSRLMTDRALTEWFEQVREYMPRVEDYEVPDPIRLGEPLSISGAGYHEGDRVELSIEFIDQSMLPLGEAPLDHGAFRWDGEIPTTAATGYAIVSMQVFEGTEEVGDLTTVSTTVARSTAAGATTPSPTSAEAEYSEADLARWYERLVDVTWRVPGFAWADLNEAKNRIEIGIYPSREAREEWEAALATLDVPRGAIVIEVGCEGIHPWPLDLGEPPDEAFLSAVDYSLEVVPQTPYGETVEIKLILRNVSDEPVRLVLGGRPPFDFEVSTLGGEQVWHWKCGKIINQPMDGKTLEPGEELEFVGEWEQVDNRGEPVPPGTYLMRGVLNVGRPNAGPAGVLITTAHALEVLK